MPYLNLRISKNLSEEEAGRVLSVLSKHTEDILGKRQAVTSIDIESVPPDRWFVGGSSVRDQNALTFYLDMKITDGTNTKQEKARYVQNVFADLNALFGRILPASYIVIHDVRADSWGFEGKTQEFRFIEGLQL